MRDLVIVGAGGLGREVLAAVRAGAVDEGRGWRPVGFLDDDVTMHGREVDGVCVIGGTERLTELPDAAVSVCVGGPGANDTRQRLVARLGLPPDRHARVVHPAANLAAGTRLGPGAVVLAAVVATAPVLLGAHTTFMPACVLTHDDVVGDYAVLAAAVCLGGGVHIGRGAYLGMGALVRQGVTVGAGATVGMGAVVLHDVPPGQTWVGVPARRNHRPGGGGPAVVYPAGQAPTPSPTGPTVRT